MNLHQRMTCWTSMLICAVGLCRVPAHAQEAEERFRSGEWELSPYATYVNKAGDNWGLGASVTYFVTKYVGVGATTYWTDFDGPFFDNVSAEAYFRLPIGRKIAPYAVGSAGYVFETDEWSGTFGGGVDFRLFKSLSTFSDIQWRLADKTKDGVFLRFGARFSF